MASEVSRRYFLHWAKKRKFNKMNEQEGKPRAAAFISIGHLCQERKRKVSNIKILKSIFIYSFNSVSIDTIKEAYLRESLSQTGERHFSKDAEPLSLP